MADRAQQLVVDALQRALAEPGGVPLFTGKNASGLFAVNAAGKQAAQLCAERGWLKTLRTEPRGKTNVDICALSEQGLSYLLDQSNPRETLEELVRSLEARRQQIDTWIESARTSQRTLEDLAGAARQVLDRLQRPVELPKPAELNGRASDERANVVLDRLRTWHDAGSLEDCPLPKLFQLTVSSKPSLTIGQFHDCLRSLHKDQKIYLHPWTGALYELPEPALALLVGHEIAYYASLRA